MHNYYKVLRRSTAVKPAGEETKLLTPGSVFKGSKKDANIPRLLRLNSIRKLNNNELKDMLNNKANESSDDIIVVLE